jgi:hypothetical protein
MNRRGRTLDQVLHHRNWPCIQAVFGAMKALGERRHFRVAVATVPSKEDVYAWVLDGGEPWSSPEDGGSLTAAFKRLSQEQGFSFLDLQPALVRASRDQWERPAQLSGGGTTFTGTERVKKSPRMRLSAASFNRVERLLHRDRAHNERMMQHHLLVAVTCPLNCRFSAVHRGVPLKSFVYSARPTLFPGSNPRHWPPHVQHVKEARRRSSEAGR